MDIPNETQPPARKAKLLQNIDVQSQLDRVMGLRLAVVIVAAALLSPRRFDLTGDVAGGGSPEQIWHSQQVAGRDPTAIDQRLPRTHGIKG
jgi:hypothetical protein